MAKRYTDTEKWNDEWYVSLPKDYKIIWQWLLDNCNHAGICKRCIKVLNLICETNILEEDLIRNMGGRVILTEKDWFIPNFLKFQYGDLQSNRPAIVSVRDMLIKKNYHLLIPESFGNDFIIVKQPLPNGFETIKAKAKAKDKREGVGERKIRGASFDVTNFVIIFEDGSRREMSQTEKIRLKHNDLKPSDVSL